MVSGKILTAMMIVLIVSGCTGGPANVDFGDGVVFNSIAFSPKEVVAGSQTALTLSLQNKGGHKIDPDDPAYVYLYGLGSEWKVKELIADDDVSAPGEDKLTLIIKGLDQPNTELGQSGEEKHVTWYLNAPPASVVPKNQKWDYTAQARVCYPYVAIATGKIDVLSNAEWLSQQQKGTLVQKGTELTQTSSPLKVAVDSKQPVAEYTTDQGSRVFLKLRLSNTGGGTVFSKSNPNDQNEVSCKDVSLIRDTQLNKPTKITIKLGGEDCKDSEGKEVTLSDAYLVKGKDYEISLSCKTNKISGPRRSMDLSVTVDYNYYLDSPKAGVSVTGLPA